MNLNLTMLIVNAITLPLLFLGFILIGQHLGQLGDVIKLRLGLYPCLILGCVLIAFLYDIPFAGRMMLMLFFIAFLSFLVELVWIPQFLGHDPAKPFRA